FPKISSPELLNLQILLQRCTIIPMNNMIKNEAILIRRTYGTKLPDAIVAATSIYRRLQLVTADKGFRKITELDLQILEP
ncbi:MAG: PIN domain-containing protein, partial [Bacteroidales bacterium]|nr:PIN domain-containing protein [Bacteroidales bacterium]